MKLVESDKTFKIGFRAVIFLAIGFFTYVMSMYYMLSQHNILTSLLFVLAFFIFAHFVYLHFMGLKNRHLILLLLLLASLNLLIFGYQGIFMALYVLAFHAGIFMLIRYIDGSSRNVIVFDSRSYFTSSGYMFTVFVTIAWSLAMLGLYQKFPFTCQEMSEVSSSVIDFAASPLKLSFNKANEIKDKTQDFFSLKMGDVFLNSKALDDYGLKNAKTDGNFVDKMLIYKQKLLDQPMKDNNELSMGICDYTLERLKSVYQNRTFQISVIIMLFLVMYGFIRIAFWVMTIIGFLLFKLLCLFRVYKFEKVVVEADKVL